MYPPFLSSPKGREPAVALPLPRSHSSPQEAPRDPPHSKGTTY